MKYYKWREMMSSGYSSWAYIAIPDWVPHKDVGQFLDDNNMLNNWSEHWRRVEWKIVKVMPRREIEDHIESAESSIEWHTEQLKMLKGMLKTYPKIKGDVILTVWEDFTDVKKFQRWAIVTKGKRNPKKMYNTRKYPYSEKPITLAKDWCEKNGYRIVDIKYKKKVKQLEREW
jgi:hypothetical protein